MCINITPIILLWLKKERNEGNNESGDVMQTAGARLVVVAHSSIIRISFADPF